MTLNDFQSSLKNAVPPEALSPALKAMWFDGKGDWDVAHNIAQDDASADGAWIHAYLHRKEGDSSNASYWYRRAGRKIPSVDLETEWLDIVSALI